MFARSILCSLIAVSSMSLVGCQTSPNTENKREALHNDVQATMNRFTAEDPSLRDFLDKGTGYVIFPSVGKGGLIVGGSYGRGEVYEKGNMIGFADISQATVGLQAGGQSFSELIVFENQNALDRFRQNKLSFAANASAVALKSGAGATARFENGVAVFTKPVGGLMFEASVGGQQFTYVPRDQNMRGEMRGDMHNDNMRHDDNNNMGNR
jgi:lipid-binding SYLF domain-containing protein